MLVYIIKTGDDTDVQTLQTKSTERYERCKCTDRRTNEEADGTGRAEKEDEVLIAMPRKRKQYPYQRRPRKDVLMQGMVDTTKMAMFGVVGVGTLGMVGSVLKK